MKRYFAMVLAVVLLCICTGAVAMGWGRTDNPPPTYTVTVTKLDKVATTSGAAYGRHGGVLYGEICRCRRQSRAGHYQSYGYGRAVS